MGRLFRSITRTFRVTSSVLIFRMLPSSISSSAGVGVGFGFSTGAGGGSPSIGAIRSIGVGVAAGGVPRDVGVAGRLTVRFVRGTGVGVGRGAIAALRRGRES